MQARYYDPVIGRFYSNDPVGFNNVHNFNRYAYANNNPYKYTDPDGREVKVVGSLWHQIKTHYRIHNYRSTANGNAVYNELNDSKFVVKITESAGKSHTLFDNHENAGNGVGTGSEILFNSSSTEGGVDDKGNTKTTPETNLAHEFGHALSGIRGNEDQSDLSKPLDSFKKGTTPADEKESMKQEQIYRNDTGQTQRTHYVQ